uniref:uncharacterized protein LOC105353227 n=1 Tax=Fragaria vesca subsp. vesca TaxID=101020 RepID=UPI0005C9ABFB|nr:PREDICTED: uncharacterized protein LOC105353227 [Fragaria vesca subsp. vesca]
MLEGNILLWNRRGIVNLETQCALVNIVQAKRPSIIFLSETLAQEAHIESLKRILGFQDSLCIDHGRESQGLALLWNSDTHVKLRTYSAHHIDVEVGKDGMDPWRFTGIYGFAGKDVRNCTWDLIEALALQQCNLAWMMAGDFNEIMSNADKSGGPPRASGGITKFRNTMTRCGLMDMGFVGSRFTWSNKFTKERLDIGFQSPLWRSRFPYSRVVALNPSDFDHNPILVEVRSDCRLPNSVCIRFRFEEGWSGYVEAESIIR